MKTWFNQPGRKQRRHRNRVKRAASLGARPIKPLRPAVHCPTVRYNMKVREGYGFTLAELKQAGVHKREARGLGIKVDYRRRNLSEEGLKVNVERLKEYKARIIVFPKRTRRSVLLKKQVRFCAWSWKPNVFLTDTVWGFRARKTTLARTSATPVPTSPSRRSTPTPTLAKPFLSPSQLTNHRAPSPQRTRTPTLTRLFVLPGNGRRTPTSVFRLPRR